MPPVDPFNMNLPVGELSLELFLARFQVLDGWRHADLTGPYWRLYWVDRPGGILCPGGRELPLQPGFATVIPADFGFATRQHARFTQFYVHFLPRSTSGMVELPGIHQIPLSRSLRTLVENLRTEPPAPPWQQTLRVRRLVLEVLETAPLRIRARFSADPRIAAAQQKLEASLEDPDGMAITNDALADFVHLNRNAFIRLFRQETGLPPQKYLTRLRINHACHLLHHSALSIEEIAECCGFCDRYHFSRVFKIHRDLGPATFRDLLNPHRPATLP